MGQATPAVRPLRPLRPRQADPISVADPPITPGVLEGLAVVLGARVLGVGSATFPKPDWKTLTHTLNTEMVVLNGIVVSVTVREDGIVTPKRTRRFVKMEEGVVSTLTEVPAYPVTCTGRSSWETPTLCTGMDVTSGLAVTVPVADLSTVPTPVTGGLVTTFVANVT